MKARFQFQAGTHVPGSRAVSPHAGTITCAFQEPQRGKVRRYVRHVAAEDGVCRSAARHCLPVLGLGHVEQLGSSDVGQAECVRCNAVKQLCTGHTAQVARRPNRGPQPARVGARVSASYQVSVPDTPVVVSVGWKEVEGRAAAKCAVCSPAGSKKAAGWRRCCLFQPGSCQVGGVGNRWLGRLPISEPHGMVYMHNTAPPQTWDSPSSTPSTPHHIAGTASPVPADYPPSHLCRMPPRWRS